MIKNILFVLPLVASCSGLSSPTVYNMKHQNMKHQALQVQGQQASHPFIFNAQTLSQWLTSYAPYITVPQIGLAERALPDIYHCIIWYNKLPFIGPNGELAFDKAMAMWKQSKQIFGQEEKLFRKSPKDLELIRTTFMNIPDTYKEACVEMVLHLQKRLPSKRSQCIRLSKSVNDIKTIEPSL